MCQKSIDLNNAATTPQGSFAAGVLNRDEMEIYFETCIYTKNNECGYGQDIKDMAKQLENDKEMERYDKDINDDCME